MLALILLGTALVGGLVLIPFGLPGLWVMLGSALLHWALMPQGGVGLWTLAGAGALVVVAEVLEFTISARYTRAYGGSRRASWGAVLGGLVGALVGIPVPVVGSLVGAFAGAFVGALLAELTVAKGSRGAPVQVATGALVGRVVAAAAKVGIGVVVAVLVMASAVVGS
jgi:hypothetical protein